MTPQPRGIAAHLPRAFVRRSTIVSAAFLVVVGAPLVATALGNDAAPMDESDTATVETSPLTVSEPLDSPEPNIADLGADLDDAPPATSSEAATPDIDVADPEPAVDPILEILTDEYTWDESGPRIVALQEALGMTPDGWYSYQTQLAHHVAFDDLGLSKDTLPEPVVPAGTEVHQWASLRDCESNGNYTIASSSGKYRGAYQFARSTWDSVADRHAPHLVGIDPAVASPADQDAMAFALYGERGASPWPVCGRHLP